MSDNLNISGDSLTPLQRFYRLLVPDKREIRNVYIYALFNGLISLSLPLGIQAIVNLIQGGQVNASWIMLVVIVVLGVALTGIMQILQLRITENLQQKIFTRAAFEFSYRIPRIKLEAIYKEYAPELMNRFFDTMSVQKGLSKILIDFSAAGLQVIFGLILLSLYHPFFILFSLILVLLVYVILRLTAKNGLKTSLLESKYKYEVAHWIEEMARTSSTFKLAGKTELPMTRMNRQVESYLVSRESHFQVLIRQYSLLVLFKVLVATGLLAIGGILVMEQLMNIGQFIAAEIIILLVMASVEKLILSMEVIYDVLTAIEKIAQVTDLEMDKHGGLNPCESTFDKAMSVELKNLDFKYPGQKENSLKSVSLKANESEVVTITGPNASGKSTLLHVIAGLYSIDTGQLLYNDLPIGNLNLHELRSVIGDALTEEELFDGTLFDNVSMGRSKANLENVRWAIDNTGLSSFVKNSELGFETKIEPHGKNLPDSIKQRLLLARSIADKPKLLLLEDTFEHLDKNEREGIIDFLCDRSNGWTLIAVSKDDYLIKKSDKILVMDDRSIVFSGSYSEFKSNSNA